MRYWVGKRLRRYGAGGFAIYGAFATFMFIFQRSLLYHPTHYEFPTVLEAWNREGEILGYCREAPDPENVWLMTHGNAGQAAGRGYVLNRVSRRDSLYVLEYPGYGRRGGEPSQESFDRAASEAYRLLRQDFPNTPVCVLGESIGSGPACRLAEEEPPPDKIVLATPFAKLSGVAAEHFPFLPVWLLLLDDWDNVESLGTYDGPVEVFGAVDDQIIPIRHARRLAEELANVTLTEIHGGHNEWSMSGAVEIRN
ncbi:MAG: alpha/beta hydrolase [Planctomycetota bacterium]